MVRSALPDPRKGKSADAPSAAVEESFVAPRPGRGGRRPGAGRPLGSRSGSTADAVVRARIGQAELEQLERAAKAEGVSLSKYVRIAALAYATGKTRFELTPQNRTDFAAAVAALLPLRAGIFGTLDLLQRLKIREALIVGADPSKSLADSLKNLDQILELFHQLLAPISVPKSEIKTR